MSLVDHELGLELELIEAVEQRERARLQQRTQDVARLDTQIDRLQAELAETAEQIASTGAPA